jgi:hypothetical protein
MSDIDCGFVSCIGSLPVRDHNPGALYKIQTELRPQNLACPSKSVGWASFKARLAQVCGHACALEGQMHWRERCIGGTGALAEQVRRA